MPRDDYNLEEEIASTNFSRVWTARDATGRRVVIKSTLERETAARRFKREIEALRAAAGPHTMPVLDFDNTYSWYVMPYASATLGQTQTPADAELAITVLAALTASLEPIHVLGNVHRDLKPANILWLQDEMPGRWVVADFGIVRNMPGDTTRTLTHAGGLLGTDRWAAPEQRVDAHQATPAADIYASAAVVSWLLTGVIPDYVSPTVPNTPAVRAVIRRALSPRPSFRYASMHTLLEAFSESLIPSSATLEEIVASRSFTNLAQYIAAHRSDTARVARSMSDLSRKDVNDWFNADPGGLLESVAETTEAFISGREGLTWKELDRFLIWTIHVLRCLVSHAMFSETEDLASTIFSVVGETTQYAPARKLVDWMATLPKPAQLPVEHALHASGQLAFFRADATDRWTKNEDNDLLRRLREE